MTKTVLLQVVLPLSFVLIVFGVIFFLNNQSDKSKEVTTDPNTSPSVNGLSVVSTPAEAPNQIPNQNSVDTNKTYNLPTPKTSPTKTPTPTKAPTATPAPTNTPTPTPTSSPNPTDTPTPTPTLTPTPTPTPDPTPTP